MRRSLPTSSPPTSDLLLGLRASAAGRLPLPGGAAARAGADRPTRVGGRRATAVVVGRGIAGVSAAFHPAARQGVKDVVIVDPRPPLTLTSAKSTECYRNWWPDEPMVGLMNRSIDLPEEMAEASSDVFGVRKLGHLFSTSAAERLPAMVAEAHITA